MSNSNRKTVSSQASGESEAIPVIPVDQAPFPCTMNFMTQMVLALSTPPRFTLTNLVAHDGIQEALSTIRSVYETSHRPLPSLFLYGTPGTGKTHILRALTDLLKEQTCSSHGTFPFVEPSGSPPSFPDLERLIEETGQESSPLCGVTIDDVHLIHGEDESHLWSLSNKLTRSGAPLLMGSRASLDDIFEGNPHVQSRIGSGLVFRLEPPDDATRMMIMDKLARDRNVRISREVIHYLIHRKARNIKELDNVLDLLDKASLERKRRITVPFIKLLEGEGIV